MVGVTVGLALLFASTANSARPRWMPKVYWAIALCETGGNWQHSQRDYASAFGIYRASWAEFKPKGVPARPESASPLQQYLVAREIGRRVGLSAWGCYRHGGYRYWMRRIK